MPVESTALFSLSREYLKPMKAEYVTWSVEERLNYCERAISLMTHQMAKKLEEVKVQAKRQRQEAKKCWMDGQIAVALDHDAQARGAEIAERSIAEVQHRFRCWQGYSDTPQDQLPFPVYGEND